MFCCDSSRSCTSGSEHLSMDSTNFSQLRWMDAEWETDPDVLIVGCKNVFQEPHTVSWREDMDETTWEQWKKSSSSGCNESDNELLDWSESKSTANAAALWARPDSKLSWDLWGCLLIVPPAPLFLFGVLIGNRNIDEQQSESMRVTWSHKHPQSRDADNWTTTCSTLPSKSERRVDASHHADPDGIDQRHQAAAKETVRATQIW